MLFIYKSKPTKNYFLNRKPFCNKGQRTLIRTVQKQPTNSVKSTPITI